MPGRQMIDDNRHSCDISPADEDELLGNSLTAGINRVSSDWTHPLTTIALVLLLPLGCNRRDVSSADPPPKSQPKPKTWSRPCKPAVAASTTRTCNILCWRLS